MKVKCDHRSKFFQFKQLERRSLKKIRASTGFEPMTSAIPVRCSTNWAMKPHIGSKVNLLSSFLPVQWNHVKYIWNNSYLYCGMRWKWSVIIAVNFFFQFKQLERRSLKKIRASTGFEPMTSAIPVRCSTNWAMKPHIGSKVNLLSSFLPVQWNHVKYIWNNSYLYCGMRWKWSVIIAVNFFQFKQLERRSLKKIRASTGFEPMTSAIPVRCSTNWAMKPHIGSKVNLLSSFLPVQWNHVKYIWNNSYLYCGMRWKWSVIIAVNFPI